MHSLMRNLHDITFFRKVVVSLCSVESSTLVWGALESRTEEQWYLVACVGSYLEGNRCGFPKSRSPRRYRSASRQEDDLFIQKVSLSRRPTAPASARHGRARRAGQDMEDSWKWWMASPLLTRSGSCWTVATQQAELLQFNKQKQNANAKQNTS